MSAEADAVAASLVTVGDGRAALGVTSQMFQKGYARAKNLPVGADFDSDGALPRRSVVDWILSTPNRQSDAVALLDQANGYAQKVYAELTALSDADPIGDLNRQKVITCFSQAEKAFQLIDQQAADSSLFADWIEAMKAIVVGVAQGVAYVVKTVAQQVFNLPPLALAAGALAVVAVVYFGVRRLA